MIGRAWRPLARSRGADARVALAAVILLLVWQGSVGPVRSFSAAEGTQASQNLVRHGRDVYLANCAVCHGESGDGNGMAAHMFRIRPRDFRRGLFRFRSTPSGSLPTDEDLLFTVTQGIRWTGMVGRADLPEADRQAVVQYLKTFSSRFATERPAQRVAVPLAPPRTGDLAAQGRRVYHLESLVPLDNRLSPLRHLGEEQQGWMVVRMHGTWRR